MNEAFSDLGDAINDARFVEVDLALRRGQHIDRDDADAYAYLMDARAVLEPFYNRYSCELVHRTDGYFFLLPLGDKVPRRLLGIPEMIVGQAAALLYLDPSTIERGGVVTRDDILSHLAAIMGTDTLMGAFNPKRKRMDERVAQETVRQRTAEALRKLTQLGFVSQLEDSQVRLRGALMRFADPVRGAGSPREALEKLIARGEIAIAPESEEETLEDENDTTARLHDAVNDGRSEPPAGSQPPPSSADEARAERADLERNPGATLVARQSGEPDYSFDSEFPLKPSSSEDDPDDDYLADEQERDDGGELLGHDDAAAESQDTALGKRRKGTSATPTSAEWDPSFDDFD
jgi:chromosome partition protein MukE